jgi:hypothetical protein
LLCNRIHKEGWKACAPSRTGMHLEKYPVVQRTLFCRRCNLNVGVCH